MNPRSLITFARAFAAVVGTLDTATGLALLAAPAFTLTQMGATVPGVEALGFVRLVGVFVAGVGANYLVALSGGSLPPLRTVFQVTLLFRGGVGLFCAAAVLAGLFDPAWLLVATTDLTCAAVRIGLLAKGVGRDG